MADSDRHITGSIAGADRMIRVLVAADSVVVRAGLEALISTSPSLTVVGTTVMPTPTQFETSQPDVVLLELDLAEENWTTALPGPEDELSVPIVVLVDPIQSASASIGDLLRSNVRGILPDDAIATEIITTIEAVATGLIVLHPDLITSLLPTLATIRPAPLPTQTLTPRELEVLTMMAEGLGNKTIARRLTISEHTVKFHVGSILSKLNASSRTEAVTIGARQGLILL